MDREEVEEIIRMEHETRHKACEGKFFPWSAFNRSSWALIALSVTLIGSGVAWAMSVQASITEQAVRVENTAETVRELKATYSRIDKKLDVLISRNSTTKGDDNE